jgi:transforming growth factor-beta-induced protein
MYKTFTPARQTAIAAVAAAALVFSASAMAAKPEGKVVPGKPGQNAIVENGTIVDIAIAVNGLLGEFDYLLGAVGCLTDDAGNNAVVDLLSGSDKYTLFAPTDAAFEALQGALGITEPSPELTCAVDDIFGEGTLFTVLAYHVTDGRRFSNSVFNANSTKEIEMLAGGYITTTPDLSIIDGVPQVIGVVPGLVNINASNGVIHVIDTVMLPFNPFE